MLLSVRKLRQLKPRETATRVPKQAPIPFRKRTTAISRNWAEVGTKLSIQAIWNCLRALFRLARLGELGSTKSPNTVNAIALVSRRTTKEKQSLKVENMSRYRGMNGLII